MHVQNECKVSPFLTDIRDFEQTCTETMCLLPKGKV